MGSELDNRLFNVINILVVLEIIVKSALLKRFAMCVAEIHISMRPFQTSQKFFVLRRLITTCIYKKTYAVILLGGHCSQFTACPVRSALFY
jgi:hypothetical protein